MSSSSSSSENNRLCIIEGDYSHYSDFKSVIEAYARQFNCQIHHIKEPSEIIASTTSPKKSSKPCTNSDEDLCKLTSTTLNTPRQPSEPFTCFIIDDFTASNQHFAKLEELQHRHQVLIYGFPVLRRCITLSQSFMKPSDIDRPLYCNLMSNAIVCFTGYRRENKNIVAQCIKLVHYMGGSVRKEYNKRITHLIVKSTMSAKYKTAYNIGRCFLLTEEWITDAWNYRHNPSFNVNDAEYLKKFKLKALYSLYIDFYGFSKEETQHMKEVTAENGGNIVEYRDPQCTHIVVNDQDVKHLPQCILASNTRAQIVRAEWFWASIQICCRASECLYEFTKPKAEPVADPPKKRMRLSEENSLECDLVLASSVPVSVPVTSSSSNVLANLQANLVPGEYESPIVNSSHRLSTDHRNLSTNLSTSASLLDATTDDNMSVDSPYEQKENANLALLNGGSNFANGSKKLSKRSQRIYELYETEKRFVNILHTIIFYFKQPIEAPDQAAGAILDQTELKEIFGNLPPIYEVHCKIKERLEALTHKVLQNDDAITVGDIYLDNADSLLKTYPPFVNFYEKTKEAIIKCDQTKPRFHAFLKIAQSKPECCRQTLVELLIRPVQRLPSTLLILDDILKETTKTHKDHELLSKAIASLKEVMTHINEDKRKVESQLAMFVLINDIENCPATLLSSHRILHNKIDAYEMSNELLKKGSQLTLFLFSDCLEICKPRLKLLNAAKSPNAKMRSPQKCYKHIALFSFNHITKICDIVQNGDDTELFGILCRFGSDKDKFFSFKVMSGQEIEKKDYIKLLAQGICNVKCITEYENVVCTIEAKQLQMDLNESSGSKKFDTMKRYASRINRRVSRAFSFSQDTPNKIKKTISSVFRSPFQGYSASLNDQKSSKLSSLASLQLTPTIVEKRKFITIQNKSTYTLSSKASSKLSDDTTSEILEETSVKHTATLLKLGECASLDSKSKKVYLDRVETFSSTKSYPNDDDLCSMSNAKLDSSLNSLDSCCASTVGL